MQISLQNPSLQSRQYSVRKAQNFPVHPVLIYFTGGLKQPINLEVDQMFPEPLWTYCPSPVCLVVVNVDFPC